MNKEMLATMARSKEAIAAFSAISGAIAGAAAAYVVLMKKFEKEFQDRLDTEVMATRNFYTVINKTQYPTPTDAALMLLDEENAEEVRQEMASYDETLSNLNYREIEEGESSLTEVVRNVFTDAANSTWDPEAEEAARDRTKPYILEHDEFYESDRDQSQLTWFEGDGVLADDKDEHIPDIDGVVGLANLEKFGHGSRDPNILYIRNEKLEVDFEIVLNEGKYTEQIMGFIQHEDAPHRVRKFRLEDE